MSGVSTGSGTQSIALPLTNDQILWQRFRRDQRAAKCTNSALNQRDLERFAPEVRPSVLREWFAQAVRHSVWSSQGIPVPCRAGPFSACRRVQPR